MGTVRPILVTGATGFVGHAVCARLRELGIPAVAAVRAGARDRAPAGTEVRVVGDLGPACDWRAALAGAGAVIHLAARVHVMRETATDPLAEFRRTNVAGTEALARAAAAAGATRIVFASSIKVNGEATGDRPYTEDDPPRPEDPYGISKREAEEALARVGRETGLEFAVVRPPLVYGPGVKGNFLRLMQAVAKGLPLPLGAARNRRSLVYVGNLADALVRCATHPAAANGTFLVSDGEDLSTAELVARLGQALGRPARLLPVPPGLLRGALGLLGKGAEADRLLGSLQVDASRIRREIGWSPPFTVAQGLAATAAWFKAAL